MVGSLKPKLNGSKPEWYGTISLIIHGDKRSGTWCDDGIIVFRVRHYFLMPTKD